MGSRHLREFALAGKNLRLQSVRTLGTRPELGGGQTFENCLKVRFVNLIPIAGHCWLLR